MFRNHRIEGPSMNDVQFSLNLLDTILKEARRDDMTFAECAGLYAGAKAVCTEFHTYIDERCHGGGYAHEKASQFEWHIGAALGFDVTNGHDKSMHIGWAMAAHSTLSDVLMRDQ
jgi:hypothetical protein